MIQLSLNECVEKYITSRKYCPKAKDKKIAETLLNNLLDHKALSAARFQSTFDPDLFHIAVRETVENYSNSKDNAIRILKDFTSLVNEYTNTDVSDIKWPKISISSSFERQMYISKYLQNPEHAIDDLQDLLWVSQRTIEKDLGKLRGYDKDPIQICGRKYIVKDTQRSDGKLYFKSTVHPFFLTFNLTQVIVILEGLKEKAEDPFLSGYAINAACDIWEQLSDYGKTRIRFVLENLMPTELSWYDKLNQMQYTKRDLFTSEALCSKTEGCQSIIECLKNERPVFIEYDGESGIEFIENATVLEYLGDKVLIRVDGIERALKHERVLRSAETKEMLV